jgi:hypothetical protein
MLTGCLGAAERVIEKEVQADRICIYTMDIDSEQRVIQQDIPTHYRIKPFTLIEHQSTIFTPIIISLKP